MHTVYRRFYYLRQILAGLGLALCVLALGRATAAQAQEQPPDPLADTSFEQRLDQPLPLDLTFTDDNGQEVNLHSFFGSKPVILSLGYYQCPMLCPVSREGLLESLQQLDLNIGTDFNVVNVSIDPRESSSDAMAQKAVFVQRYGRSGADGGWHFLTGSEPAIKELTGAAGFRYSWDERSKQWAHPAGIIIATPQGKISRYFYGITYPTRDLRLGLVEASNNKIGTVVDQLLLLCYSYDPVTATYSAAVMKIVRLGAIITTLIIGFVVFLGMRRNHAR